uniref:Uncharacterized protein n=1 Tax=Mycobacterium kansasii TaxID=1768 RepID=A0A653ETM4_MYCKA|nr:hypothetical protein BIN_B_02544 [Mycobacterium kansasii]
MVEGQGFAVVEECEVVVGVAGQANHIRHGQQGAPAGERLAGGGFEVVECGGHDDGGRQAVVLAQLTAGQQPAQAGQQSVVVALALRAAVTLGGRLGCRAVDHRAFVVRVAHARSGQLGQHRVEGGACLRGQIAADPRHPIQPLLSHGQTASPCPVLIGEGAVGIEAVHESLSQLGQLVGPVLGGQPGQMGLGFLARLDVHLDGQVTKEVADHPYLTFADMAAALGGSGGAQLRRQRFAGQRAALTEFGGLRHPPAGLCPRDPQPGGQRRGRPPAQLLLAGLLDDLVDQCMLGYR